MSVEVECHRCGKKCKAPEASVGKHAKCPRCKTILAIPLDAPVHRNGSHSGANGERSQSTVQALSRTTISTPAATSRGTAEWTMLAPDLQQYGPVSKAEMDAWAKEGRLDATCQVYCSGWTEWKSATEVYPELNAPAVATAVAVTTAPEENPFAVDASHRTNAPETTNGDKPFNGDMPFDMGDMTGSSSTSSAPAKSSKAAPTKVEPAQIAVSTVRPIVLPPPRYRPGSEWYAVQIGLQIVNCSCWIALAGNALFFISWLVVFASHDNAAVGAAPPKDNLAISIMTTVGMWGIGGIIAACVSIVTGWFTCRATPSPLAGAGLLKGALICVGIALAAIGLITLVPLFGGTSADAVKTMATVIKVSSAIVTVAGTAAIVLFAFFLGRTGSQFRDPRLAAIARWFSLLQAGGCLWALLNFFLITPEKTWMILILIVNAALAIGSIVWLGILVRRARTAIRQG